jgi:hypothetical protein
MVAHDAMSIWLKYILQRSKDHEFTVQRSRDPTSLVLDLTIQIDEKKRYSS